MKKFYCEYDKRAYNCNSMVSLLKSNKEYFNYYFNDLKDEIKKEVVKSNYNYKYLYKIISGQQLYCKKDNKLISFDRVLRLCTSCCDECGFWLKGVSTRGKKRPEHGAIISKKLKGVKKTEQAKVSYKKRLSSIDFKKKVLQNKNIKFDCSNESEILEKYRNLYSVNRKSIQYKKRFCIKNYSKYINLNELNSNIIDHMNDQEILNLFSELMSIKSSRAMAKSKTMGNHIISYIEGLTYNMKGLNNIEVRSTMEKKVIIFFEKNKILWDYEDTIIDYYYKFNRKYIIDFKFILEGQINYLEVKGSVRSNDADKIYCKIQEAINKFKFIYVYQGEPLTVIKDLDKILYKDFNNFKLKHIYEE